MRKLEVGDCTRARKTPKQQATRRADVDKGYHLCVCTDSNPTNIWNRGFWTSAPLPLSIGSLAEQPEPRMPAKQVIQAPNLRFLSLAAERSPGTVGLKPNVELNASYRILYLRSRRRALFDPLWEGWRNFSTPSSEGSAVGTLFFCTLLPQKALRRSPQLTHTNFSFARWDEPLRALIFSYLLFQIVNSCASYYPSSCDYSPCSTRKRAATVAGAWSLFIMSA